MIGYLYIRVVDAIRYEIYRDNLYFVLINDQKVTINLPEEYKNKSISIILSNSHNYDDYLRDMNSGFRYIYINGKRIENKNKNIINLDHVL